MYSCTLLLSSTWCWLYRSFSSQYIRMRYEIYFLDFGYQLHGKCCLWVSFPVGDSTSFTQFLPFHLFLCCSFSFMWVTNFSTWSYWWNASVCTFMKFILFCWGSKDHLNISSLMWTRLPLTYWRLTVTCRVSRYSKSRWAWALDHINWSNSSFFKHVVLAFILVALSEGWIFDLKHSVHFRLSLASLASAHEVQYRTWPLELSLTSLTDMQVASEGEGAKCSPTMSLRMKEFKAKMNSDNTW